jgi:tetratricopeptide (TPR) repeat protein
MFKFKKLAILITVGLLSSGLAHAETASSVKPKITQTNAEFVYKILLAEIAGQRGEYSLSSQLFYDLAVQTQDARLAERATRVAAYARQPALALQASTLWVELDPSSVEAQQASSQLLIASGNLDDAKPQIEKLLAQQDKRAEGFMSLNALLAREKNKSEVLAFIQDVAKPYPQLPEAHFAKAQAAYFAENIALAKAELALAEKYRPGWEAGAQMNGQILFKESPEAAFEFYQNYLKQYPQANEVRMSYAKALVTQKKYELAKPEFIKLITSSNNDPQIIAVVGFLALQSEDYQAADQYLQQALKSGFKDPDQLNLYLGHSAEKQGDTRAALAWYDKIQAGQHFLEGRLSAAELMAKTQSVDAAIAMLDNVNDLTEEQQVIVLQTEATLLNSAQRSPEAFELLKKATQTFPNSPELMYDYAMTAERVQKLDVMESLLYQIIKAQPNFAPAYNALGYSYADRNIKLPEAETLIEKALILSPDDHYIIDSLGWVYFRMGALDKAIATLRKAYDMQADPEIAAHLGEVLWAQGKYDEAKKVWGQALDAFPENATLLATVKKFKS